MINSPKENQSAELNDAFDSPALNTLNHTSLVRGALYVVATPIGNLSDISQRALHVLANVDEILCEDTRTSHVLLRHFGIQRKLSALHDFNEKAKTQAIVQQLKNGATLALISDAGTPLISDPGYTLVAAARACALPVISIPGASAIVAALSIAGLPCDRFCFEGFLPAQSKARRDCLSALVNEPRTLVFYESTHRIEECLRDVAAIFLERPIALAKELTKQFERVLNGSAKEILTALHAETALKRGEFVLIIQGAPNQSADLIEAQRIFHTLAADMPKSQAAKLAAKLTGISRQLIYKNSEL
jgi:16S rRNA (cytidine1402-2'-O)-methyltransferase